MSLPKLAAFGAFGVMGGLLALLAFMVWLTLPGPDSGVDMTNAALTWIAVGGIVLVLGAVHFVYARILLDMARAPRKAMAETAP
ncbi:MAG TPA: hypothetical protein VFK13_06350 [Gemmatimonadaceae bacterium]|nr:hypothetical protein [Gemmatimonadaceae bacterium]